MATQTHSASKHEASRWSLASNGFLLVLKLAVAMVTGSVAVLAELVNSAGDLVGSAASWLSVRASDEPPDHSHAYGHGKIENLAGAFSAGLVIAGGFYTVVKSIEHLIHPSPPRDLTLAIGVMAVSALVNCVVSTGLLRVAKVTNSPALKADGLHLRTDILTSAGALAGLVLVRLTHRSVWDPVFALIVSAAILRVGFLLAKEAVATLADSALPDDEERKLEETLWEYPGVLGFHKMRTRKSGSHRHLDVHVQISDTHSFVEAHRLTEALEDKLRDTLPNLHPIIHIEPYADEREHQRRYHQHDPRPPKEVTVRTRARKP